MTCFLVQPLELQLWALPRYLWLSFLVLLTAGRGPAISLRETEKTKTELGLGCRECGRGRQVGAGLGERAGILGQGNRLLEAGRGTVTSCPQAFWPHLPPPNSIFWSFLTGSCTELLRNKMEPGD